MTNLFIQLMRPFMGKGLSRIPGAVVLFLVLFRIFGPKGTRTIIYDGVTMEFDVRTHPLAFIEREGSRFLPCFTATFKDMIKPGMRVVILGAAEGYYALKASELVGRKGRVYAFEPSPDIFRILARNIKRAGAKNVVVEQKAVCDRVGKARFYLSEENPLENSLGTGRPGASRSIEVETTTLDAYFGNEKINFIKMNIEGSEPLVLRGMQGILTNSRGLRVMAEYDPKALKGLGYTEDGYLSDLLRYFKLQVVDMKREVILPYKGTEQVRGCMARKRATHLIGERLEV